MGGFLIVIGILMILGGFALFGGAPNVFSINLVVNMVGFGFTFIGLGAIVDELHRIRLYGTGTKAPKAPTVNVSRDPTDPAPRSREPRL